MTGEGRTVPLAIVGCGYWGSNLIRNFGAIDTARVVGFCRADPVKLAKMAEGHPGARLYPTIDEVVADPDLEAVAIATPAPTHFVLAEKALLAGKHVFVEKPMTLCPEEARRLVELSEASGLVLMVGHLLEYAPAVRRMKQVIESGALGAVRHMHMERVKLGKVRSEENVLWSFAPHDISMVGLLLGPDAQPVAARAVGHCILQSGIEDIVHLDLEYSGGVTVHIHVSWLHPEGRRGAVVVGDAGMLVLDDLAEDRKLTLHHKSVDRADLAIADDGTEPVPVEDAQPLRIECEHFLDCIVGNRVPVSDGRDGLRVVRALAMATEALRAG